MSKLCTKKLNNEHELFIIREFACGELLPNIVKKLYDIYGVSFSKVNLSGIKTRVKNEGVYERFRIEYINGLIKSHGLVGDKHTRLDVAIELLEKHLIETPNSDERVRVNTALNILRGDNGVKGNSNTIINQRIN
jgi:hypothetical protein